MVATTKDTAIRISVLEIIMHDEPRELFRQAILASLPHLQPLVGQFFTQCLVWRKLDESHWHGEFLLRPDMVKVFAKADKQLEQASAAFCNSFATRHPEYSGMVGFGGIRHNWAKNTSHIVRSALGFLWAQHKSFDLTECQVDAIVKEFGSFVDSVTVRLRFLAQLVNFKMSADSLVLPGGLTIRRLTEEEVSQFHGGPIETLGLIHSQTYGMHEFVLEGELDEPKSLGEPRSEGQTMAVRAKVVLDKAVLSLRTFKEGHVGYDYIHFQPVAFCPLARIIHDRTFCRHKGFCNKSLDLFYPNHRATCRILASCPRERISRRRGPVQALGILSSFKVQPFRFTAEGNPASAEGPCGKPRGFATDRS